MSSLIHPDWQECFDGANKGWMDLVLNLKYGGVSAYGFQGDVNLNTVFQEFSTATDPKDKSLIQFISDPEKAFMVRYRQLWLSNKRFNCLQPIKESFKKADWLITSFGADKQNRLCMYRAIYLSIEDGKTVKEHVCNDDNGMVIDHPIDVLRGLYLILFPRCLVLEWKLVKANTEEDKGLIREPLHFTQHQIMLVMNWLGIGRLALRPTNLSPVGCIHFIAITEFDAEEDRRSLVPPAPPSSPKSTIAQTVTTSTQTDSEKEAMVTQETSEQQPPQSPKKNDNICHVPHCTKFIWHVDCDRCEGHCGCFCGLCDKVFGHKKDPCKCVQSGAQPETEDERLTKIPTPTPAPPVEPKTKEDEKNKKTEKICDDCMKIDCECDDEKAEHITHKEAEKELPACPECGDPTECEVCGQCSEHCCVWDKKAKCGAQTDTTNDSCKMRAKCHKCAACRLHSDPTCTGCDQKKAKK